MIENIPRYKHFALDTETLERSVYMQTIAKTAPQHINWPEDPLWKPTGALDIILKNLQDKYHGV